MSDKKLVRIWDRDWETQLGQLFVDWEDGTFTLPAVHPVAVELWGNRDSRLRVTVESTPELLWCIDGIELFTTLTPGAALKVKVICRPFREVSRISLVSDEMLIGLWLDAEKRWKDEQKQKTTAGMLLLPEGWEPMKLYDRDGKQLPADWKFEKMRGFSTEQRVAQTEIGGVIVSTVWLMGINHEYREGKPPLLFETMVFGTGAEDNPMRRYATEEQAVRGHIEAVDIIRRGGSLTAWEEGWR
jgi:hypothetical protein